MFKNWFGGKKTEENKNSNKLVKKLIEELEISLN
jgi:hypothetical protein